VLLALAALPARADEPAFRTELTFTFGWEGQKTERPLVVLLGVPSSDYAYRADSAERSVGVTATRFFGGVADDGATPLALLPLFSRRSSVGASISLAEESRDSFGVARGRDVTLESSLSGDGSVRSAGLSGAWYFLERTAVVASLAFDEERRTDASRTVEHPTGKVQLGENGLRSSRTAARLGAAQWLGGDLFVAASALYGDREDRQPWSVVLSDSGSSMSQELGTDGRTWGATANGTAFLLERRLLVELSGSYARSTADLSIREPDQFELDSRRTIDKTVGLSTAAYPYRTLGVSAQIGRAHV
jgi:hypothetical protein